MHRSILAVAAFCAGLIAAAAPAAAYVDPLTRQSLDQPQGYQGYQVQQTSLFGQSGALQSSPVRREVISYEGRHAPGTVIVSTSERRLYYLLGGGQAIRYGIGVGREGFTWAGTQNVAMKREWPDWRPPAQMLRRRPDLPRYMAGGVDNPLGARAMYLGNTLFRIHGSNEPESIGLAVSSGCIRMANEDVIDLYDRVRIGTRVVVMR